MKTYKILFAGASLMSCQDLGPTTVGQYSSADIFSDGDVRSLADNACRGNLTSTSTSEADVANAINASGQFGITPLEWAVMCGSEKGVVALLSLGANPNIVSQRASPLQSAIISDNRQIFELLLANGADPNVSSDVQTTPLSEAVSAWTAGRKEFLPAILEAGADPNGRDSGGSVFQSATATNQFDAAELLLKHGYSGDLEESIFYAKGTSLNVHATEEGKAKARSFLKLVAPEELE